MKKVITLLFTLIISLSFSNVIYADLSNGLVAYYPFNGNANDESGHGNHGTVYGASLIDGPNGEPEKAYHFDGISNYISSGNSQQATFAANESFTISVWIKSNDSCSGSWCGGVISKMSTDPSYADGFQIGVYGSGVLVFEYGAEGQNATAIFGSKNINDNQWHHIVGVVDKANGIITGYVDGILENSYSANWVTLSSTNTNDLKFGNLREGSYYYKGSMSDIRIYNRAFSNIETFDLYNSIPNTNPVAIAGSSLDGNSALQLDGTLSTDANGDSLTFEWQIQGEAFPRIGQIVSVSDLIIGTYTVDLTVSDGALSSTDTMLFGVSGESGTVTPTPDAIQQSVTALKDTIGNFPEASFDAPNSKARENRRKALLNMLDKVYVSIEVEDYQAAIGQMRDILVKSDELDPPDSAPDWIIGTDGQAISQAVTDLVNDMLMVCSECS